MTAPGIVPQGRPLSDDDVRDRLDAIRETYGGTTGEVAVVGGFGAAVVVERGHLELRDGVGEHRRERRFAKTDAPRRVVVTSGTDGVVSLESLRWCASVGTPVVILGRDGALLAAGPPGRTTARLLRAQALALHTAAGVEVTRYVISSKLRGQARVLTRLADDDGASLLLGLACAAEHGESIDEVRAGEAGGANVYWSAWERLVEVRWTAKDRPRVPSTWCRFNGRRSAVHPGSPRTATDPVGAMLNYGYKLCEAEATLALRRMGMSETLGVLHADMAARPSFSCDVMEAVRPLVDEHVLAVAEAPLRKRTFVEDSRGVVRVAAPMSHRLAEAMPAYATALGPVVEHVAGLLSQSSPYDVSVPTILSGAKHRVAARRRVAAEREDVGTARGTSQGPNPGGLAPRGRPRRRPVTVLPIPDAICQGCGALLPVEPDRDRSRRGWCDACLPERRVEVGSAMQAASRAAAETFAAATGTLPSHTPEATAARRAANARQVAAERSWEQADTPQLDERWYVEQIAPKLAVLTLPAIARATGVSTSAASKWRSGRTTPHPRHWAALASLAGVPLPAGVPDEGPAEAAS